MEIFNYVVPNCEIKSIVCNWHLCMTFLFIFFRNFQTPTQGRSAQFHDTSPQLLFEAGNCNRKAARRNLAERDFGALLKVPAPRPRASSGWITPRSIFGGNYAKGCSASTCGEREAWGGVYKHRGEYRPSIRLWEYTCSCNPLTAISSFQLRGCRTHVWTGKKKQKKSTNICQQSKVKSAGVL